MKTITRTEAVKLRARLDAVTKDKLQVHDVVLPNGQLFEECSREYLRQLGWAMAKLGVAPPDSVQLKRNKTVLIGSKSY